MPPLIPANIITGFLGVGKTTAILHLLAQKPVDETWAVLVNEFGEIGIDGAMLQGQGAVVREIPGGCMCCVAGLPMKIGLNMLLAKQPDRLLIEPTGLGHPLEIIHTLTGEYYNEVLDLRASIALVDPNKLTDSRYTENENFRDQLALADVVVANKTDRCGAADRQRFEQWLDEYDPRKAASGWVQQGELDIVWLDLPRSDRQSQHHHHDHTDADSLPAPELTLEPDQTYLRRINEGQGHFSGGWLFSADCRFQYNAILALLHGLNIQRIKAVLQTEREIVGVNAENGVVSISNLAECADSRIEFIHNEALPWDWLESQILECLVDET